MTIDGTIVEVESKPWSMNGQSGVSYCLYVSGGRARDGAQRVKVKPEQFGLFSEGQEVSLPVGVFARASDFGGPPRIELTLDPEWRPAAVRPVATPRSATG
jgi:hypothetical protein